MSEPIPKNLWERLKRFLDERQTGSVVLHVQGGAVHKLEVHEHVKAEQEDGRGAVKRAES